MNKNTVSGKIEQTTGKIKEKTGEILGNQKLANQGVADQIKGMAKETYGKVQDAAHATTEHAKEHVNEKHDSAREAVKHAAQSVKASVSNTADNIKNDQQERAKQDRRSA